MSKEKITRAAVEKNNRATANVELEKMLNEVYGACYAVEDGFAVPVGKSPLDEAEMWVVFPYVKAKAIQTYKWGKTTREYYNGYDEAAAYELTLKEKAEKDQRAKENKEKRIAKDTERRKEKGDE